MNKVSRFPRVSSTTFLPAAFILAWFLFFAHGGLVADFSGDDLMNLDYYVQQGGPKTVLATIGVFTQFYRPLGGVFYLSLYKIFGMNPLPFRLACFGLLLANMLLFYRFFRLLSGKPEAAWIALFLVSYHAWFVDLYYSTGTVYELLCVFFYLVSFTTYVKIRSTGEWPKTGHWMLIAICYAAALDSKELAVTLPIFVGLYELIYHAPDSLRKIGNWVWNEGRGCFILAICTLPYVWLKMSAGGLGQEPEYAPRLSALVFMHTFQIYLNPFFYLSHVLRGGSSMVLLGVLLLIALFSRQRHLIFGWFFLFLSVLPFIFIPHYAALFFYLPALGWGLMAAGLLLLLRDLVLKITGTTESWKARTVVLCILLIPTGLCIALGHYRESPKTLKSFETAQVPITPLIKSLQPRCGDIKSGAVAWFQSDPFPGDSYSPQQAVRLTCGFREAAVLRGGTEPKGRVIVLSYDGKRIQTARF
jgi:hypothetical protein